MNILGMDPKSGIFKVQEAGVYQLTFTGFAASIDGHMVCSFKINTVLLISAPSPLNLNPTIWILTNYELSIF